MSPLALRRTAAAFGACGVALGAFGAHAFKAILERNYTVEVWRTAVFYQLIHAVVLLWLSSRPAALRWPPRLFSAGIFLFSGGLYLYALTLWRAGAHAAPFGGGLLLAGWLCLLCARE